MVCLSFDIEEFDLPSEHGVDLEPEEQIRISRTGAERILDILKEQEVKGTFFTTVRFAKGAPDIVKRIVEEGHELASHGMEHSRFALSDLRDSREELEKISGGKKVEGYRQARMMKLDEKDVAQAGYRYDSSLNPTFIPGRYMSLDAPRRPHLKEGIIQVPSSVTPVFRFPLFWLSAHVLPQAIYRRLVRHTLRKEGYIVTYFHPWEFYELGTLGECKIPWIVKLNSGKGMEDRLRGLIKDLKNRGARFGTIRELSRDWESRIRQTEMQ